MYTYCNCKSEKKNCMYSSGFFLLRTFLLPIVVHLSMLSVVWSKWVRNVFVVLGVNATKMWILSDKWLKCPLWRVLTRSYAVINNFIDLSLYTHLSYFSDSAAAQREAVQKSSPGGNRRNHWISVHRQRLWQIWEGIWLVMPTLKVRATDGNHPAVPVRVVCLKHNWFQLGRETTGSVFTDKDWQIWAGIWLVTLSLKVTATDGNHPAAPVHVVCLKRTLFQLGRRIDG